MISLKRVMADLTVYRKGYLRNRYGAEHPLALSASLAFEQSYGWVEGDSASSAELYCLLSAVAEIPLRQDIAVTGSVNQHGEVQAVGAVNEKIEGFFDICRQSGLTGTQGVCIPRSNLRHLELRPDVVEAVRAGKHLAAAQQLIERGFPPQVVWSMLGDIVRDELKDFPKAASYYKVAADKGEVNALLKLALLYDRELNSIEKAEEYFRLAAGYGDTEALALQAASYFEKRWRKPDALRIMRQAIQAVASEQNAFGLVMILLWNDEISEAIDLYGDKFANVLGQNEVSMRVTQILLMFLAKRQYQFINTLFRENTFDIRDKYKPVYFAMLSLMGATRADELRVMGPEYEETVEEIVREVKRVEAYDL